MSTVSEQNLNQVFHDYDIRGLIDGQLDTDFFYHLGKACVTYLSAKNLVVGHDIRETSLEFKQAFIEGVQELGCNVLDIGLVPTELLYYSVGAHNEADGGVVITASHNPKEWNGAKIVGRGSVAIGAGAGLEEIKALMFAQRYSPGEDNRGEVHTFDPWPGYIALIKGHLGPVVPKLKLLVDAGNGIGGILYDRVLGNEPFEATKLFFEPDSSFPNHDPNPKDISNLETAVAHIQAGNYDVGIAFDGDADRVIFIDSKGRAIESIYIATIIARYYREKEGSALIVHDPRVIYPLVSDAQSVGYTLIEAESGRTSMKAAILENKAVFGFENSGHFFYRDLFYSDASMITVAILLKLMLVGHDLTAHHDYLLEHFPISGEVNFRVADPDGVIKLLAEKFASGHVSLFDGVSVDFADWRFNLRKSNTEALVRLNVEARSAAALKENYQRLVQEISGERESEPLNPLLRG
jgi:phosphomannomutase